NSNRKRSVWRQACGSMPLRSCHNQMILCAPAFPARVDFQSVWTPKRWNKNGQLHFIVTRPRLKLGECLTSACAGQHLLGIGSHDLDRIRMELPRTSVERFERSRRRLCGFRSAFCVTDLNSLLQALKRVSVGADQILKE